MTVLQAATGKDQLVSASLPVMLLDYSSMPGILGSASKSITQNAKNYQYCMHFATVSNSKMIAVYEAVVYSFVILMKTIYSSTMKKPPLCFTIFLFTIRRLMQPQDIHVCPSMKYQHPHKSCYNFNFVTYICIATWRYTNLSSIV